MGTRNYQEKKLSSFRDIPEKDDFFDIFFKNNKNVKRFLRGKFSDFFKSEYSRICLENSSLGTKNNQVKISSSFRDIFKKVVFFDLQMGDPCPIHHHPPSTRYIKKFWYQKRSIIEGVFEIKKVISGEDITPKEIKLGPRRGATKTRFSTIENKTHRTRLN